MTLSVTYTVVDGELLSENRNGVKSDYIPDPQGSTAALIIAEHVITDTFSYWPYGELRSHVGSSVTPYGYTGTLGPYTDSASNRVYEEARVYRPQTTVWQTMDPLWPGQRPYCYIDGRPLSGADPSGLGGLREVWECAENAAKYVSPVYFLYSNFRPVKKRKSPTEELCDLNCPLICAPFSGIAGEACGKLCESVCAGEGHFKAPWYKFCVTYQSENVSCADCCAAMCSSYPPLGRKVCTDGCDAACTRGGGDY